MKGVKRFFSSSMVLVVGTILMSGINYAYNLFVNRLLTPTDYATYAALLGILALVLVPAGALQAIAAKYAADGLAENDPGRVGDLLRKLTKRLLPFCILGGLVFLLFPQWVAGIFNAGSEDSIVRAIMIMSAAFIFQLLLPVNRGILQGSQRFFALSLNYIVDSLGRFIAGMILLIPLTGQSFGQAVPAIFHGQLKLFNDLAVPLGIAATIIGSVAAYAIAFLPMREYFRNKSKRQIDTRDVLRFSIPTLLMVVFSTILFNVDIIMVKRFSLMAGGITPDNAGEYATISTLAKLIFYVTGPMVAVMFPMVSDLVKRGERHVRLLLTTLVVVLAASLVTVGIFAAAPTTIIRILTPNYVHVANLLVPMTIIFLVYSLVNVMTNYFLSIKNYRFLWPLGIMSLAEVVILVMYHPDILSIIQVVILTQTVLLAGLLGLYMFDKRQQIITAVNAWAYREGR